AIPGKKARAAGRQPQVLTPVRVLDRDDETMALTVAEHYQRADSILLLFRKGSDRAAAAEHLLPLLQRDQARPVGERQIKQLTYHSAKGLQADAVFLVGDCQHVTRSPYKNQVYRQAGLGKPGEAQAYDKAQQDETLRLAYVAVTRAVSHCYWYVEAATKDAAALPKASDNVAGDKPFFEDLRSATTA
ncbi:3'-5' exonuclease, partial [Pseudomonas sp.]